MRQRGLWRDAVHGLADASKQMRLSWAERARLCSGVANMGLALSC